MNAHAPPPPAPPIGLLVELTHRCPLGCPYCSNPLALERPGAELDAETWKRVFSEAAALGALHVHLSGGEPTARRDIAEIVRGAARGRALHQPYHLGRGGEREALERHRRGRTRPCAALVPGRRQGDQRPSRPLWRLMGAQARLRRDGDQGRPAAHAQRGYPVEPTCIRSARSSISRSNSARAGSKSLTRSTTAGRSPIVPR